MITQGTSAPAILVTGSSSGIGRAIVLRLAAHGFSVVAGIRRREHLEPLRADSPRILPVIMDVTEPASIERAAATVQRAFPRGIDALVNNAGVAVSGPLELVPRSQWQRQYEVNVFGIVNVTQGFLPMLRRRRGRIVNIGSASSNLALPMVGPYASSKYAVDGLSDSLRRELVPCGIKVIVVSPGQTATPIFDKSERESVSRMESMLPSVDYDYSAALERFQQLMHRTEASRRPPERVAAAVLKALTAKRPKRRYRVGWDAHASVIVQKFVPDAIVDWVIAKKLGQRSGGASETQPESPSK